LEKWRKKREDTYYGSSMHFYRSLLHNQVEQQGFVIYHLIRKQNPERPAQLVIVKKLDKFNAVGPNDSIRYWNNLYHLKKYNETLIRQPLTVYDIVRNTDEAGIYALTFPDNLYVVYTKKHDEVNDVDIYRPLDMENFMVSILTLYKPAAFFDRNGVVVSGESMLNEGAWARNKIPELLPVDYAPAGH
jgi:hypothetical protein